MGFERKTASEGAGIGGKAENANEHAGMGFEQKFSFAALGFEKCLYLCGAQ
ncbi:MAG: hypothetical protein IIX29_00440 [Bacteroidales bacterium]|nr:hypothetical protein [Bacteroidales bacterium]